MKMLLIKFFNNTESDVVGWETDVIGDAHNHNCSDGIFDDGICDDDDDNRG